MDNSLLFYLVIFILGACIGSFLNVVIYRLPIMLKNQDYNDAIDFFSDITKKTKITAKFNLAYPNSHCPNCKKTIPFWANVPIIGYFFTQKRCFYCKLPISLRYPLVEFLTAAMFLVISYLQPNLLLLSFNLFFISITLCCVLISFDDNEIPSILILPLLWLGIILNIKFSLANSLIESVVGAVAGYALIKVFILILHFTQKKFKATNDGSIIAAAIGAWFGYIAILKITIPTIILFILYNLVWQKLKKIDLAVFIGIFGIIYLF